jgi:hypothetical protein
MGGEARVALIAAAALAGLWLIAAAAYLAGLMTAGEETQAAPGALTVALALIAAAGPAALAATGWLVARRVAALERETEALRAALVGRGGEAGGLTPAAARAATEAARAAAAETARGLSARLDRFEAALAGQPAAPAPASPPARRAATTDPQAALPFAPSPAPPSWEEALRALDFPRDEDDAAGFAALRAALRDPELAQLLQAAEDVLSILAADALHMEDLRPAAVPPAAWRAYGEGARGAAAEAVGAVRDPEALARTQARMRRDPVFRDACLVFARRWGQLMARAARELGEDPVLSGLGETRSGRAFMLTARAMGAFS